MSHAPHSAKIKTSERDPGVCSILNPGFGYRRKMLDNLAMTDSQIMRICKTAMIDTIHNEAAFSEMFIAHLLTRPIRKSAWMHGRRMPCAPACGTCPCLPAMRSSTGI